MMRMRHTELSAPGQSSKYSRDICYWPAVFQVVRCVCIIFITSDATQTHDPKYHLENHSIHKHENSLNFTFYMVHTADTWNALNKNSRCFVA